MAAKTRLKTPGLLVLPFLAGCSGDLTAPAPPDFAKGGRVVVTADAIAEDSLTVTVQISWSGGSASSWEVEMRGPEATDVFVVGGPPVIAVVDKFVWGPDDEYTSDYIAEACVRPVGSKRFSCDDVLIPGIWTSPPPDGGLSFARPVEDIEAGDWTPSHGSSTIWSRLDEGQPHDSDASFIESTGVPEDSGSWIVKLGAVPDPGVSTGHILYGFHEKNEIGGRTYRMHYELWQGLPGGGEMISSGSRETTNSYRLGGMELLLSEAEADAITNYGDLYVRGFVTAQGGGQRRTVKVTLVELEVPVP